jgi:apolipoprotein D and lipocalin family protein
LLADGKVSVHNYAAIGSPTGTPYTIDGYAYAEDPNELSKLKVHFTSDEAHSPFDAPYWILSVGPIVNGLYEWAIVSDNLSMTLFVLARNADTYNSQYKAAVNSQLQTLGFTGYKAPIDIYQGSDCKYDTPSASLGETAPAKKTPCKHSIGLGGLWSGLFGKSNTVTSLDVPAYMGLWYQEYGNAFVFATSSGESPSCATALYTAKTDGHIAVHNYELNKDGAVTTIDGYAYQPDATKPGQLKLHIDSVPVDGPYYIYALGPINAETKLYDWAVVSDPFMLSLFILSRDHAVFVEKYEKDVLALVESLGFTSSMSKPIVVPQGASCKYEQ